MKYYLVVEFEQRIVYGKFIALEPLEKVADYGKSVDDRRSHGWFWFVVLSLSY